MPSLDKILEELHFLSDRISTQVRLIALGLITLVWALLVGTGEMSIKFSLNEKSHFIFVGVIAIIAMVIDYLQYFFGYLNTHHLHSQLLKKKKEQGDYNYSDWRYRAREKCFWVKQVCVIISSVWFVSIVIYHFVTKP